MSCGLDDCDECEADQEPQKEELGGRTREIRSTADFRIRDHVHGYRNDGASQLGIRVTSLDGTAGIGKGRCDVKIRHLLFLAIFAIGALYIWHNYSQHGGIHGLKSGVGLK